MARRLYFHHIQKTAGMSLHAAFEKEYGPGAVSPQIYGMNVEDALRTYRDKSVVAGHLLAVPGRRVPEEFYSITVLRDPVERFISHLFFNLKQLDTAPPPRPVPRPWWDRILEREARGELSLSNWQTESLFRYGVADDREIAPAAKLEPALRALEQFSLVGTVEELKDVLLVVALECGWKTVPALPYDNATPSRPSRSELDAETALRIELLNALDMALWRRAGEMFRAARSRALGRALESARLAPAADPAETRAQAAPAACAANDDAPALEAIRPVELGTREMEVVSTSLGFSSGSAAAVPSGALIEIRSDIVCNAPCDDVTLGMRVQDEAGHVLFGTNSRLLGYRVSARRGDRMTALWRFRCSLGPGTYRVHAVLHPDTSYDARCYHMVDPAATFTVSGALREPFDGRFDLRPMLSFESATAVVRAGIGMEITGTPQPLETCPHLDDFRCRISVVSGPGVMSPGEVALAEIEVMNLGSERWPAAGERPVSISYHWIGDDGEYIEYEGIRNPLLADMEPGDSALVRARVLAPGAEGEHMLQWTLVQEGVAWFHEREPAAQSTMTVRVAR